jgi:hypothetical protein
MCYRVIAAVFVFVLGSDALWCTARIMTDGHEVTLPADLASSLGDHVGPFVGDEINATFGEPPLQQYIYVVLCLLVYLIR